MYSNLTTRIKINNSFSDIININKGLKQGCPLSPILFNLCIDDILKSINETFQGYTFGDMKFNCLAYADDIIIFSSNGFEMEI